MEPASKIYKPLPESLKRQGFRYECVERKGDWAIYRQIEKANDKTMAFELVRVGRHNGFSIAGLTFPPAETYPSSSLWGSHGWTYPDLEIARQSMARKRQEYAPAAEEILEDRKILKEMYRESEGDPDSL
jgi:hypothetical protein